MVLTKAGSGTLTIKNAANTFSGGTIINAGQLTMDLQANAALGTGPVTLNGGRLFLERITAANALTVNGGDLWPENGFGDNWNGPVTLNSNLIIQGPGYATMTFNGSISGVGGLTLNGQGPVVLAVANSYTGPTSVTACTLQCKHKDALGSGALSISSTANSKVNLNYTGTKNIASLTLGGVPQTGGTHGSTASPAANKNDTYFSGTGTVTVPLSSAKDILTFSFGALGSAAIGASTINLDVPIGTDRTALAPTYTLSPGATCSPISGTSRNFTSAQIYTVTAQDGSTKAYTVTVTEAILPNIFTWVNAAGGNWSVAANWTNEECYRRGAASRGTGDLHAQFQHRRHLHCHAQPERGLPAQPAQLRRFHGDPRRQLPGLHRQRRHPAADQSEQCQRGHHQRTFEPGHQRNPRRKRQWHGDDLRRDLRARAVSPRTTPER